MARYRVVVMTNPVAGREDAFNDWYAKHMAAVVRLPGFTSAQRFKLRLVRVAQIRHQYLTFYDMNVDSVPAALAAMDAVAKSGVADTDAVDHASTAAGLFEACGALYAPNEGKAGPFLLIAMTDPVDGRDAEYNDFYTNVHMKESLNGGGFCSAERFKLLQNLVGTFDTHYIALYKLVAPDWPAAEAAIEATKKFKMTPSTTTKRETARAGVFESCSPFFTAPR